MTEFSQLVRTVNKQYITNPDGSLRLDSLGRRIHVNSCAGKFNEPSAYVMIRIDKSQKSELKEMANKKNTTMSALIRDYIEWGMENDS